VEADSGCPWCWPLVFFGLGLDLGLEHKVLEKHHWQLMGSAVAVKNVLLRNIKQGLNLLCDTSRPSLRSVDTAADVHG